MKPTRNLNECSEIIRARGGSEPEPARQVTRPRVAEEQGPGCLHAHGTSGWCPHSGDRAVLLESHRHLDTWPGTKEVDRGLSPERNTGEGPGDFQHENQGSEPARPDPRTTHPAPHIPRLPRVSPACPPTSPACPVCPLPLAGWLHICGFFDWPPGRGSLPVGDALGPVHLDAQPNPAHVSKRLDPGSTSPSGGESPAKPYRAAPTGRRPGRWQGVTAGLGAGSRPALSPASGPGRRCPGRVPGAATRGAAVSV